jgi:hypothetical protein
MIATPANEGDHQEQDDPEYDNVSNEDNNKGKS